MNELSLFTGAGGGVLGSKLLGWNTIGYVEYETYCQEVLRQRIADGVLDTAPIFGDIRAFVSEGYAGQYRGMVDVVTAGFPCQPFSTTGKRLGEDDPRNMWPATLGVLRAIRPKLCLLENVAGLVTSGYFGTILRGLAESGYDARWKVLSAAELGAPHKRDRLWIVAYSMRVGWNNGARGGPDPGEGEEGDAKGVRLRIEPPAIMGSFEGKCEEWPDESNVVRILDGVARRLDRLKAVGNGQVPVVAATAWNILTEEL